MNLLTVRRYKEDSGAETLAVIFADHSNPDNFSLMVTPAPAEGEVMNTLRKLLSPGWEDFLGRPNTIMTRSTVGAYMGRQIDRSGYSLYIYRNFATPEELSAPNLPAVIAGLPPVLERLAEEIERGAQPD